MEHEEVDVAEAISSFENGEPFEPIQAVDKHSTIGRSIAGVLCGIVAGVMLTNSLWYGTTSIFPQDQSDTDWSWFAWGNHWAIRTAASLAATAGASLIAAAVARRRAKLVAIISSLPTALSWLAYLFVGWRGELKIGSQTFELDAPLGYKIAAVAIVVLTIPIASWGGGIGELVGEDFGAHFDSRSRTLFGIKWFHYLWIPPILHLELAQAAWAAYYTTIWITAVWRAAFSFLGTLIPSFFMMAFYGSIYLMVAGASRAYRILAGFETPTRVRDRALGVLKYGIGAPALAALLQTLIMWLQIGLLKFVQKT